METTPRCEICGKFIELDPETRGVEWDGRLVWTGYHTPEPSHDEFWHIECANKEVEERNGGMNGN